MSRIKRRQFLQFAGSTLAALGLSQLDVQRRGLQYAKVLAQSTRRKLALLVGINAYPQSPLQGCITDTLLQRELLIHRFGFNPQDILIVTDETDIKPTREGILQAFAEHLIKQAKPGDVVTFHFSGHGSRVIDSQGIGQNGLNSTLVPIDRSGYRDSQGIKVNDIMGRTLFLLMSAIQTDNFTGILDSCHSGGGKRGNLKVRAYRGGQYYPTDEELEYQQSWLSRFGWSEAEFRQRRQQGVAKGVVIASATADQFAADAPFDGFHAGAFSYIMTQYLWQETGSDAVSTVVANVARSTTKISGTRQIPEYEAAGTKDREPTYFSSKTTPPAEAVITEVNGDLVKLWLGGINPQAFAAFNRGAVLSAVNPEGQNKGLVQLESRDGITGFGKVLQSEVPQDIQNAKLLQEKARAVPKDLSLQIGLDGETLNSQEISTILGLKIERLQWIDTLGVVEVHYIFGRMTEFIREEMIRSGAEDIPALNTLGLYGQGLDVIPGSFGQLGETVPEALERLQSKFRSLLAARVVKVSLNADSSRLQVFAGMRVQDKELVATAFTARGGLEKVEDVPLGNVGDIKIEGGVPLIPVGNKVELTVENREDQDLYVTVLVIDPEGGIVVIYPNSWTASSSDTLVKAGTTRRIPDRNRGDSFSLLVGKPLGTVEVLIVSSFSPLTNALKSLQSIADSKKQRGGPIELGSDSVGAIDGLLGDFNEGAANARSISIQQDPDVRAIDTSLLAAMSITFKVVKKAGEDSGVREGTGAQESPGGSLW